MILKNQVLDRSSKKPILWDAFFKPNDLKKPLVIFCHGYKGFKDWGAWHLVADAFKEANCFFVKFNFSHNGGTMDHPIDFPDLEAFAENNYTKELDDLESILDHLLSKSLDFKNEIDRDDVTVIGHSRGGGISILKASEDSRITKLITWASVSDFGSRSSTSGDLDQWRKEGVKYVLNGRTKQEMPHNFQFYEDFKANEDRLFIEVAEKRLAIPHLIIHGEEDDSVPFSEAQQLHQWNSSSHLLPIENANHVFNSKHPWELHTLPPALDMVVEKTILFIKD
ncbi:S9 family peptidase [Sediminibacter sp. Hel_I_10]|uniref:alpha/beta hydrolase family protein n=1 Tax=Sediminibacter sp. Hel_I_10 TaxID=1392490 RepID=UPI00047D2C33|nr:alpha/beta hydrolase [Sediminibacter sp. Hel_I_10]